MMREIEDLGPLSWNAKIIYTNQVQNLSSTFFLDELLSLDIYGRNKFYCYFDLPAKVVDTNPRLRHGRTHFIGLVLIFEQLFKVISSVFLFSIQTSINMCCYFQSSIWLRTACVLNLLSRFQYICNLSLWITKSHAPLLARQWPWIIINPRQYISASVQNQKPNAHPRHLIIIS